MSRRCETSRIPGSTGPEARVEISDRQTLIRIDLRKVRALVRKVAAEEGRAPGSTVSLAFVDDEEMRRLNRRFRKRSSTTDVLAFPLSGGPECEFDRTVGEVVVSTGRAIVEAQRRRTDVGRELSLYIIHGLLHLFGYDDKTEPGRRRMRQRERFLLAMAPAPLSKGAPRGTRQR